MHAVLHPFLEHTDPGAANNVLFFYIQYHLQLGYSRFFQYTQARRAARCVARCRAPHRTGTHRPLWRASCSVSRSRDQYCVSECCGGLGAQLCARRGWARGGPADAARRRQSIFVASFLADPRLAALVDAGRLVLVLWEGTAWCSGPAHIKCWQPVIYSHAILMGWGMANLRLALADHDEYLALPSPSVRSVQALVKYCFRGRTIARLWRYDAFCAACASADDEADLWSRGPAGGGHPMQHYTTRKRQPYKHEHGKAFVDPEHAGPFEVLPRAPPAPRADATAGCRATLCRPRPAE